MQNKKKLIILLLVVLPIVSYYSNFEIQVNSPLRKISTIVILAGLFWTSNLIFGQIKLKLPDSFYEKKWCGIIQLVPILTLLFLISIQAVTFDSIRDYHYKKYGKSITGTMLDEKYYFFKINEVSQYGQISYDKIIKRKGDSILIHYSEKNPIINEPIK